MNTNEFFYWLQGYFELRDSDEPLTAVQAACVQRHIDLVRMSGNGKPLDERVVTIGAMAAMLCADETTAKAATSVIRKNVHDQFEHVIDPQAGNAEQQAKLNAMHSGQWPYPGKPVIRC